MLLELLLNLVPVRVANGRTGVGRVEVSIGNGGTLRMARQTGEFVSGHLALVSIKAVEE